MIIFVIILAICLAVSIGYGIYLTIKYNKKVRSDEFDDVYRHVDEVKRSLREEMDEDRQDMVTKINDIWYRIDN